MKQTVLIFALVMLVTMGVQAQSEKPNVLKINPISLAFGNFNVNYQRALTDGTAIQFGANYWYRILGVDVTGIGMRAGYQFFITKDTHQAPKGLYVGPQVSYNNLKEKGTDASVNSFGVGAMIGYQWVWDSGVTLDLGAGPMYQFASESGTESSFDGFLPNITIAIGFNF